LHTKITRTLIKRLTDRTTG